MTWRCLVISTLVLAALLSCTPNISNPTPTIPANPTPAPSTTPEPASGTAPSALVPRITIEDLLYKIHINADIIIVDTRVDVETQFDIGHIKGAIPVPLSKIISGQWLPTADKEIILYCT